MTAQIGDIYKYQNKEYHLVALSSAHIFNPKKYGLEPHASSTACSRGYWCEYAILDDILLLKDLYLFNRDDKYPPLNGTEVSSQEFEEVECHVRGKSKTEKRLRPAHFGHRVYRDVNMPVPYTGKILLGDDFIWDYYIHMGFQRSWAYRKLIELVFEEGILIETHDHSHIARALREAIQKSNDDPRWPDRNKIANFVEDCFSLDYSVKAWWIKDD